MTTASAATMTLHTMARFIRPPLARRAQIPRAAGSPSTAAVGSSHDALTSCGDTARCGRVRRRRRYYPRSAAEPREGSRLPIRGLPPTPRTCRVGVLATRDRRHRRRVATAFVPGHPAHASCIRVHRALDDELGRLLSQALDQHAEPSGGTSRELHGVVRRRVHVEPARRVQPKIRDTAGVPSSNNRVTRTWAGVGAVFASRM